MTMPFDPYGYPAPMAPQRALLARPDYLPAADPLAVPDAPQMALSAPMNYQAAGPPSMRIDPTAPRLSLKPQLEIMPAGPPPPPAVR